MGQVSAGPTSTIRFPAADSLSGERREGPPPGSAQDGGHGRAGSDTEAPLPGGPGHSLEMALGLWGPAAESRPHGWDRLLSAWRQSLPVLRPLSFLLSTLTWCCPPSDPKLRLHLGGLWWGWKSLVCPHQWTNQLNHQAGLQAQLDHSSPGCGLRDGPSAGAWVFLESHHEDGLAVGTHQLPPNPWRSWASEP